MERKPSQLPPTYSEAVQVHPSQYVHSQTVVGVHQQSPPVVVQQPVFAGPDVKYLKTPSGIAKIVAAVSEMIRGFDAC